MPVLITQAFVGTLLAFQKLISTPGLTLGGYPGFKNTPSIERFVERTLGASSSPVQVTNASYVFTNSAAKLHQQETFLAHALEHVKFARPIVN